MPGSARACWPPRWCTAVASAAPGSASGRCHDADLAPPYWPWLSVLRDLAGTAEDVPPEVTALLEGTTTELAGEAPDAGAAAATTLRTFAAVSRWLGGQPAPVVVVLEDLHWSDRTSLRLLAYAAQELRERPVLLVATVRTVDPRSHPHLAPALAGLTRLAARRVPVPPLDAEAVAELLEEVGPVTDPALVEVLTRRADGNPFFVLEMARLLQARGRLDADAAERLEVPDGIADVLRLRVEQRPAATQETLGVAAVAGRDFDARLLAEVLGRSPLDDLDDAVAAGVVEPAEEPGRFRFVHALTRETVYRDLSTRRRGRVARPDRAGAAAAARARPGAARRGRPPLRRRERVPAGGGCRRGRVRDAGRGRGRATWRLRGGRGAVGTRPRERAPRAGARRRPAPRAAAGAGGRPAAHRRHARHARQPRGGRRARPAPW